MSQGSRIRHNPRIRPWREDRIIRGSELRSDRGTLFLPKLRPPQSAGSLFSEPSRFHWRRRSRSVDRRALATPDASFADDGSAGRAGEALYDFKAAYTLAETRPGLRIAAIAHNQIPRLLECIARRQSGK